MIRNSYNEGSPLLHAKYRSINLPTTFTFSSERSSRPKHTASFQHRFSSYDRSTGDSHIMDSDNECGFGVMNLDDQLIGEVSAVSTTSYGEKYLPIFSVKLESLQLGGAVITWKRGILDRIRSLISSLSNVNRHPEPVAVTSSGNFTIARSGNVSFRHRSGVHSPHHMSSYSGFLLMNKWVNANPHPPIESTTKTINTIPVDRSLPYLSTFLDLCFS